MVDPVGFGFNFETAESNAFQQAPSFQEIHEIELLARKEFDSYANLLTKNGRYCFSNSFVLVPNHESMYGW